MTHKANAKPRRKFHTTIVMGAAHYGMFITESLAASSGHHIPKTVKVPVLALDFNDLAKRGEWSNGHKSMTARTLCEMHGIRQGRQVIREHHAPPTAVDIRKPGGTVEHVVVLDDLETADHQTPEHRAKVRRAVEDFAEHRANA